MEESKPEGIVFECILNKLEQDKDGLWTIKLNVDSSQYKSIMELSRNTQKLLRAVFFAQADEVYGSKIVD